jgi:Spy/CpxP family protein refolding chaperone
MRIPALKIIGLTVATVIALGATPAMAKHHHKHHHHPKHPHGHGPGDNIKG